MTKSKNYKKCIYVTKNALFLTFFGDKIKRKPDVAPLHYIFFLPVRFDSPATNSKGDMARTK